ncbi:MAG TPA: dihydrofolate reductase family protein [Trueperaceae bacterium]
MQELMIDFIVSLDGHGESEGWPGFWGLQGPEYLAWLEQQPPTDYVTLMGAKTYRLMSGMAVKAQAGELAVGPDEEASLATLAQMPMVVFSATLDEPLVWPKARLERRDAVEAVAELKRESELPLRTLGSVTMARSLLSAGLVDRLRLVVFPVITGKTGQRRVFDDYPDVALELVDSRLFDGRLQLLEYVPTVLEGPPSATR